MQKRLENLREKLVFQWGELAEHLDVSRSMLDQVRRGTRAPGPKLLRRIEAAEKEAGIGHSTPEFNPTLSTRGQGKTSVFLSKNQNVMMGDSPVYGSGALADLAAFRREIAGLEGELMKRLELVKRRLDELERKIRKG